MKKNVQETSMISYAEIKAGRIGELQQKVLDTLRNSAISLTDREIIAELGIEGNSIRPRRYELVKKGLVEFVENRKCSITGKLAKTWKPVVLVPLVRYENSGKRAIQNRLLDRVNWFMLKAVLESKCYRYMGNGVWERD